MARKLMTIAAMVVIWGAAVAGAVLIGHQTDVTWNAEAGYLLVAAVVTAAWVVTDLALAQLHTALPYAPEER